jgi:hypothetical protein
MRRLAKIMSPINKSIRKRIMFLEWSRSPEKDRTPWFRCVSNVEERLQCITSNKSITHSNNVAWVALSPSSLTIKSTHFFFDLYNSNIISPPELSAKYQYSYQYCCLKNDLAIVPAPVKIATNENDEVSEISSSKCLQYCLYSDLRINECSMSKSCNNELYVSDVHAF